jgi:hypothetical protein
MRNIPGQDHATDITDRFDLSVSRVPRASDACRRLAVVQATAGRRERICAGDVPHLQRLLGHLDTALKDLEQAAGV